MFTIYAEKEIFENIVLFNEQYPNLYSIFCNHANICLNIDKVELAQELENPETIIFLFMKANGGKSVPVPLNVFFQSIYEDNAEIVKKPRSIFFLNCSQTEAAVLQAKYGIIVQSAENIDDSALCGSYYINLSEGEVIENGCLLGWHSLIAGVPALPSNTLVVTDTYLFSHNEQGRNIGLENLVSLADALLPKELDIPYHIAIFSNDHPDKSGAAKSKQWCEGIANELKLRLSTLRPYDIIVEVIFTKTIHKRKLILNYVDASADNGFAIFSPLDNKKIKIENDFRFNAVFSGAPSIAGDSGFKTSQKSLSDLKTMTASIQQYIQNAGPNVNRRILGDCNADHSIRNRLINDA